MSKRSLCLFFLSFFLTVACIKESSPSQGEGGGNGGGAIGQNFSATDKNGNSLGYVIGASNSVLYLISPKGYFYTVYYDGHLSLEDLKGIFTDNDTTINKDNLYVDGPYIGAVMKKSAYPIRSTTGGIPNLELFCHGDTTAVKIGKNYYFWARDFNDTNAEIDFGNPSQFSDDSVVTKVSSCSHGEAGIPSTITPPINIYDKDGNQITKERAIALIGAVKS